MIIGAIMGMIGAMSGELFQILINVDIRNVLDGKVWVISGIVAVILYVAGGFVQSREIRNMDVRV